MLLAMTTTAGDEAGLVEALKDRDESAFAELVDLHTPAMLRVARGYVRSREIAEDVVQETWIAVLKGINAFEGRSSLRTWLFTILINIAKRRGMGERLGVLQPATMTTAQTAGIRSRRTPSAWHRYLAIGLWTSSRGVGQQRRAYAAVVGGQLEMPDFVRIDLTQPERLTVAEEPVVGVRGADIDSLADHMLGHLR